MIGHPCGPEHKRAIRELRRDIKAGKLTETFDTAEEVIAWMKGQRDKRASRPAA